MLPSNCIISCCWLVDCCLSSCEQSFRYVCDDNKLTLPEHLSSSPVFFSCGVHVAQSLYLSDWICCWYQQYNGSSTYWGSVSADFKMLVFYVAFCRFLFVHFLLAIVLSVLLGYKASDYPFAICKLFIKSIKSFRLKKMEVRYT